MIPESTSRQNLSRGRTAAILVVTLLAIGGAAATETPGADADEVQRFCNNITDAARDRRHALQMQELQALQGEIDARIQALEAKRAEYEDWLKKRQAFLDRAEDSVVKIYATMKPDAAAERLSELKVELAAGILMKLEARKAGIIMNEMDRKSAAAVTQVMAAVARKVDPS